MSNEPNKDANTESLGEALTERPTTRDKQIMELQDALAREKDARKEERFLSIFVLVVLLDIVFFSVMPSFGGPLALLVLELMILIPLAQRMGVQEIAKLVDRVLGRIISRAVNGK